MLTPMSELPELPKTVLSYWPIHAYTLTQIVLTIGIFIVTLTVAGPAFPLIIIALVPTRLLLMNKFWNRETLRYVDAWACREGTPEGDEDRKIMEKARIERENRDSNWVGPARDADVEQGMAGSNPERCSKQE